MDFSTIKDTLWPLLKKAVTVVTVGIETDNRELVGIGMTAIHELSSPTPPTPEKLANNAKIINKIFDELEAA